MIYKFRMVVIIMHSAHQVSIHIIDWCYRSSISITNLKLQKLLYFVQGEYYRIKKERLIREEFYAWQLGPVIPEIYFEFSIFSSSNIPNQGKANDIVQSESIIIDKILNKYKCFSTWDLVELSHEQDPWKYNYEIFGNKSLIPFKSICEYFGSGEEK